MREEGRGVVLDEGILRAISEMRGVGRGTTHAGAFRRLLCEAASGCYPKTAKIEPNPISGMRRVGLAYLDPPYRKQWNCKRLPTAGFNLEGLR